MARTTREAWFRRGARAAALLAVLGALVWVTGLPVLFPSLGPTAYLFAARPRAPESAPHRVIGGHAIGVAAGLLAFHLLAVEATLAAGFSPGSMGALRLAASGVLSVGLTAAGMLATDTGHAPACATTLIVALGILSAPIEGVLIVAAVVVLTAEQWALLVIDSRDWTPDWPQ